MGGKKEERTLRARKVPPPPPPRGERSPRPCHWLISLCPRTCWSIAPRKIAPCSLIKNHVTIYIFHRGNKNINFRALGAKPLSFAWTLLCSGWGEGIGRPPRAEATALPNSRLGRGGKESGVRRGRAQGRRIWCAGWIGAKFFKTSHNTGRDGSYHLCGALCLWLQPVARRLRWVCLRRLLKSGPRTRGVSLPSTRCPPLFDSCRVFRQVHTHN